MQSFLHDCKLQCLTKIIRFFRITEKAMVRASCGVNSENHKQMMETSALDQAVDQIAMSNGKQLYVHM